jgi:hypothetical protein
MRHATNGVGIDCHELLPCGCTSGCYSRGPIARQQRRSI